MPVVRIAMYFFISKELELILKYREENKNVDSDTSRPLIYWSSRLMRNNSVS